MKQKNYGYFLFQQMKSHGFSQANLTCIEKKDHFDLVEKLCEKEDVLTQFMITCVSKAWCYLTYTEQITTEQIPTYQSV